MCGGGGGGGRENMYSDTVARARRGGGGGGGRRSRTHASGGRLGGDEGRFASPACYGPVNAQTVPRNGRRSRAGARVCSTR